jgi:hypothetical protein
VLFALKKPKNIAFIGFAARTPNITKFRVITNYFGHLFFLNNQPDALIIPIYSVIKLYMLRASSLPNHQEFSAVHSALVNFMQVLMTVSKQSQDGVPS